MDTNAALVRRIKAEMKKPGNRGKPWTVESLAFWMVRPSDDEDLARSKARFEKALYKILKHQRQVTVDELQRLSEVFKVSMEELLRDDLSADERERELFDAWVTAVDAREQASAEERSRFDEWSQHVLHGGDPAERAFIASAKEWVQANQGDEPRDRLFELLLGTGVVELKVSDGGGAKKAVARRASARPTSRRFQGA